LDELGYGLMLDYDVTNGEEIRPERYYEYHIEQGPVEVPSGGQAMRGSVLLGLRDGRLSCAEDLKQSKRLMRRVIHHHLGGKPLKSRELFKYIHANELK